MRLLISAFETELPTTRQIAIQPLVNSIANRVQPPCTMAALLRLTSRDVGRQFWLKSKKASLCSLDVLRLDINVARFSVVCAFL